MSEILCPLLVPPVYSASSVLRQGWATGHKGQRSKEGKGPGPLRGPRTRLERGERSQEGGQCKEVIPQRYQVLSLGSWTGKGQVLGEARDGTLRSAGTEAPKAACVR